MSSCWLSVFLLSVDSFITSPDTREETRSIGLVILHLVVFCVAVTLAFDNFKNTGRKLGYTLILSGSVFLLAELGFVVYMLVGGGLRRAPDWGAKDWYLEAMSVFVILLGTLLWWLAKSTVDSSRAGTFNSPNEVPRDQPPHATPSAVWLRRVCSCVLDYTVYGAIVWVLTIIFGEWEVPATADTVVQAHESGISIIVSLWAWAFYFVGIESVWGKSPGQFVCGLAVVLDYPSDRRLKTSLLRHACDLIEIFPFGIPALMIMLIRKDEKRLGDIIAGSRVVNTW
jgi:uncharacterized RDD family membrane protein YckC